MFSMGLTSTIFQCAFRPVFITSAPFSMEEWTPPFPIFLGGGGGGYLTLSAVASRFPTVSKPYLQLDYEKEQGPPRADEIRLRHVEVVRCNESCGPCPFKKKKLHSFYCSSVYCSHIYCPPFYCLPVYCSSVYNSLFLRVF